MGLHLAAVEGGQHQAAVTQVLVAVEQQHRALAEDRPEQRVGLAGVQLAVGAAEDLLDQLGVEHHHEALIEDVENVTASP